MALLRFLVFAPDLAFAFQIDRCRLREGEGYLSTAREIKPIMPRIAADFCDEVLALCSSGAVAFVANDPVEALAVHHDVDGESNVAVRQAFDRDPVLSNIFARFQTADRGAVEACGPS